MKTILIADDEADLLETISFRLEASGYSVITALDGQEAVDKARAAKPDIILLDVMMPKMNGFQACKEIKTDPATRSIPIIILSAKTQQSDKFWGEEVGADSYVTKPFEAADLLSAIKKLIGD